MFLAVKTFMIPPELLNYLGNCRIGESGLDDSFTNPGGLPDSNLFINSVAWMQP
jgi:hypothetical protein